MKISAWNQRVRYSAHWISFFCLSMGAAFAQEAQEAQDKAIDDYIHSALQAWSVPGLAIAVVKDDEIVLARGYGVQEAGSGAAVDEHTLFGIGSATKQMTAAALAMLVDGGLVDWDDPVVRHLPEFKLYDPWVTEQVTIRDLLAHRVGVGRMIGNRVQYMTNASRSELIYRMRHLEPERPFRSSFTYHNVMYTVAGEIVDAVTGESWDDFLRTRIFKPLEMTRSNTSIQQFQPGDRIASPHTLVDNEIVVIPFRNSDNVGPAGSVNATAVDMAQWMRLQLNHGTYQRRRLISREAMQEMHTAQMVLPSREDLASYGLGWRLSHYQGYAVSAHGGGVDGMTASVFLVPAEQLGVVVLSNLSPSGLPGALAQWVADGYLGIEARRDWSSEAHVRAEAARMLAQKQARAVHATRVTDSQPTLPLKAYVGSFYDELYGQAEIRLGDNGLELRLWGDESAVLQLTHWQYDSFKAAWPNAFHGEKFVWFSMDQHAGVNDLHVEWTLRQPPDPQIRVTRFRRVAENLSEGIR